MREYYIIVCFLRIYFNFFYFSPTWYLLGCVCISSFVELLFIFVFIIVQVGLVMMRCFVFLLNVFRKCVNKEVCILICKFWINELLLLKSIVIFFSYESDLYRFFKFHIYKWLEFVKNYYFSVKLEIYIISRILFY